MDGSNFTALMENEKVDEQLLKKYLLELELIRNFQLDVRTEPK